MGLAGKDSVLPESYFFSGELYSHVAGAEPIRVSRTTCASADPEKALAYGGTDSHIARLYLRTTIDCEIIQGGKRIDLPSRFAMETSFRDVHDECIWPIAHPLDIINFELPRSAVRLWAEESDYRGFDEIKVHSGMSTADETIRSFGFMVLKYLRRPERTPQFLTDNLLDSMCHYLVRQYGGHGSQMQRRGLSASLERRAKEIIDANLGTNISLRAVARQCGMSVSHFSREFRQATGMTPYQWLTQRRIEHALVLFEMSDLSLTQIALRCGFSDQSHFNHVFKEWFGTSPGAHRRWPKAIDRKLSQIQTQSDLPI